MIERSLEQAADDFMKNPVHKGPLERRKLKAEMIQFLAQLWEKGVLDGATMEDAFSVTDDNDYGIKFGIVGLKVKYFVSSPIVSMRLNFESGLDGN
jgi:hypothetical protein